MTKEMTKKIGKKMTKTLERLMNVLSGLKMTIVAGVFLLIDLIPHILEHVGQYERAKTFEIFPFEASWLTVLISGVPLLYLAISRIIYNKGISKISSALLISIAMIAAVVIGDVFAAGEVAFIMAIGEILEEATANRAKKGLKNLISLAPSEASRLDKVTGDMQKIKAREIKKGDLLRILPGEKVPVDGKVVSGETSVDQSIMTGESLPVDKRIGDEVFCGTINRFGSIDIEATKVGEDSSLSRLIQMVKEAENKQAPMQRIADKWASYLVPVSLLTAIITYFATGNITTAVTILVVFCPCALVLATPTAIMAAIGQASKYGVIIKSGEALEKMGKVNTIAFDKTGTLTHGNLEVSDIVLFIDSLSKDDLLSLVASAESKSEHPIAKAIVKSARDKNLEIIESQDFQMNLGRGVIAKIGRYELICGNQKFLQSKGVELMSNQLKTLEELRNQGKATILVASNLTAIGIIALSDVIRENANAMISKLQEMKTNTVLLTGDNKNAAAYFAEKVGIDEIKADLLPENKVENINTLQRSGRVVCMLGDGVNDAPALKTADVSIAMGGMGSDIAVETADVALMSDDISKIPYLKRLSNATIHTIKFSISLAMFINVIAVILSILGFLTPTTGALVHNAGSCFVVMLAAFLYDRKFI